MIKLLLNLGHMESTPVRTKEHIRIFTNKVSATDSGQKWELKRIDKSLMRVAETTQCTWLKYILGSTNCIHELENGKKRGKSTFVSRVKGEAPKL